MTPMSDQLIPTAPLPVGIEREPSVGLPLLASWVALVAYVASLSSESGTPPPVATQLRLLQIERNVNDSINACNDFYNYSCGQYGRYQALDQWTSSRVIARRWVRTTAAYKNCSQIEDFFDVEDEIEESSGDCDLDCRLSYLHNGYVVNNVTARTQNLGGKLVMMYWSAAATINEPAPWSDDGDHILRSEGILEQLQRSEPPLEISLPEDFPSDCVSAAEEYAPFEISVAIGVVDGAKELIDELLGHFEVLLRSVATGQPKNHTIPKVVLGGGAGLISDQWIHEGTSNLDLWEVRRFRESLLVGQSVDDYWPVPASTVNAFFDADSNSVYIPSMMTMEPFFAVNYSRSLKFGGLGFVVAHELGHAIDHIVNDTGYKHLLGHRLAELSDSLYGDVSHTENEAVADEYGLKLLEVAHDPDRVTMLQTAQMWCLSPSRFGNDSHPPGRWRVNSTFSDSAAWAAVFC